MKSIHYKINSITSATMLFIVMLFIFSTSSLHAEMLSVKGDRVNLRKGPGKNYSVKWEYSSGFPVEVIERKGDWLKVKDFENDTGWMHKSLLISSPQTIVKANRNKDEKINIRNGPGSGNKIVGMAYYGVVFRILGHQTGWVKVRHESGLTGWISSNLLWGH